MLPNTATFTEMGLRSFTRKMTTVEQPFVLSFWCSTRPLADAGYTYQYLSDPDIRSTQNFDGKRNSNRKTYFKVVVEP